MGAWVTLQRSTAAPIPQVKPMNPATRLRPPKTSQAPVSAPRTAPRRTPDPRPCTWIRQAGALTASTMQLDQLGRLSMDQYRATIDNPRSSCLLASNLEGIGW
jgi:hypothetical protein